MCSDEFCARQLTQCMNHHTAVARIKGERRFVQKQNLGTQRKHCRYGRKPLLSTAQPIDVLSGEMRNADRRQCIVRPTTHLRFVYSFVPRTECDILPDVRQEELTFRILEHISGDTSHGGKIGALHWHAAHLYGPGPRGNKPDKKLEQRGFPCAVCTYQRDLLPPRDGDRYVFQDLTLRSIGKRDPFQGDYIDRIIQVVYRLHAFRIFRNAEYLRQSASRNR